MEEKCAVPENTTEINANIIVKVLQKFLYDKIYIP